MFLRRYSRLAVPVVVAVVVQLMGAHALGDTMSFDDPNDSRSPLDLRVVKHGHTRTADGHRLITHSLRMDQDWRSKLLANADIAQIRIHFDLDGHNHASDPLGMGFCGEGFERTLNVDVSPDGTLYAEMLGPRGVRGYAKVWRTSGSSIKVAFPKRLLKRPLAQYQWCAFTLFHDDKRSSENCGSSDEVEVDCPDRAPDTGTFSHTLSSG